MYKGHQILGYADDMTLIENSMKEIKMITRKITDITGGLALKVNEAKGSDWKKV